MGLPAITVFTEMRSLKLRVVDVSLEVTQQGSDRWDLGSASLDRLMWGQVQGMLCVNSFEPFCLCLFLFTVRLRVPDGCDSGKTWFLELAQLGPTPCPKRGLLTHYP